jgi:hypothetical protein
MMSIHSKGKLKIFQQIIAAEMRKTSNEIKKRLSPIGNFK